MLAELVTIEAVGVFGRRIIEAGRLAVKPVADWRGGMKRLCMVLVLAIMPGCTLLGLAGDGKPELGYILFDSYEQTTDFGFVLDGIYIDADGLVWHYHSEEPQFPDELRIGMVSESDLLHKFDDAKRVGSVHPDVLNAMIDLIQPASEAKVVREMQSYERSGSLDVAYTYDSGTKRYVQVVLKGTGTWAALNTSPAAQRLLVRLDEIKRSVGFE